MEFEVRHINQLSSTNETALSLINDEIINEGVVIWATEQSAGKGYAANSWESEKGKNLTFSLILKPAFILPADQFIITQIVSVAIRRLLEKSLPEKTLKIKWPNDIYADDKKIGGILIQNIIRGDDIHYSVVGIGLNINQLFFLSDAPNPVSMIHFTGNKVSVKDTLMDLLKEIDTVYTRSNSPGYFETLHQEYLDSLYKMDEWAEYKTGKEVFQAMVTGIGSFGRLMLKMKNGKKKLFDFKEVELVVRSESE